MGDTPPMGPIFIATIFIYCAIHFAFFVLFVRASAWGQLECGVFLFHAFSFFVLAGAAILLSATTIVGAAAVAAAVGVHGIYSLTFLEVWSLTEGSYSLSILQAIGAAEREGTDVAWSQLAAIEESKRKARLCALQSLGLISEIDGELVLTAPGRAVAAILNAFTNTMHISGERV